MLWRFRGTSDSSPVMRRRRSWRASKEGELRLESAKLCQLSLKTKLSLQKILPSLFCVTVMTSNDSILVRLSCNFLTRIANGD